jgi:AcrR family transcriptional regulator
MSGKSAPTRKPDSRVRRTRNALGDALMALMQERPFDDITVQDILDRAQIGRSTFYMHYRDKDDLFLSDVEDFLEMMSNRLLREKEASNRIVPVRELLQHFAEMRPLHNALIEANKMRDFLDLGHGYFARAIDKRLADLPETSALAPKQRAAMSQAFAGAFLSLVSWWMSQPSPASSNEMDEMFHQLVWSGALQQSPPKTNRAVEGRKKISS